MREVQRLGILRIVLASYLSILTSGNKKYVSSDLGEGVWKWKKKKELEPRTGKPFCLPPYCHIWWLHPLVSFRDFLGVHHFTKVGELDRGSEKV